MKKVTATGKTVEDAIQSALQELDATREMVTYRVLEEPSKGFLGLIGVRDAKVEVILEETAAEAESCAVAQELSASEPVPEPEHLPLSSFVQEEAGEEPKTVTRVDAIQQGKAFLEEVLSTMGIEAEIEEQRKDGNPLFIIKGSGLGLIIGRRGQTLDSLQYLVNVVANRHADKRMRIVLDAENYREKRKEALEQLADRMANQVVKSRKPIRLEPMNPAERKIIHSRLQKHPKVETFSEGAEPYRRVVITVKK
ncbi:protein jag [Aneurinibacillus sp. BA2021]|nr:protein jag [Aneurinibacillus sp. BA2021]